MKLFLKDYWDVYKGWFRFYKKHWFGTLMMILVPWIVLWVWLRGLTFEDRLKKKVETHTDYGVVKNV